MLSYFSPNRQFCRFEKKFEKTLSANEQQKTVSIFCDEFQYLLKKNEGELLFQLFSRYLTKIDDITALRKKITIKSLKEAIGLLLKKSKSNSIVLKLYNIFELHPEAIDFLAKSGQANIILTHVAPNEKVDKDLLHIAIESWEKYNGDIHKSPALCNGLKNIAEFAIEAIPNHPHAKEVIGQFEEAAALYEKKGKKESAASCYEKAQNFAEALRVYKEIYELNKKPTASEGMSKAYESLGDIANSFKFVVNPERKVHLLIKLELFPEAKEYAAGLESPETHFEQIKQGARKCIDSKLITHNYLGAIELIDSAEYPPSKKDEILQLGRQQFDKKLASASSEDEINLVYRNRAELEERSGNFEEAAKIANDILRDTKYASLLYKKANKFDIAISVLSNDLNETPEDEIKILELAKSHEEGGNLLEAAQHYETIGNYEKAFGLYENNQLYQKALECYLKADNPSQDKLIELYKKLGKYEKIIDIYMKSGQFGDLEKALSISTNYNLTTHSRLIQEEIDKLVLGNEEDLILYFNKAKSSVSESYSPVFGIDFGTTNSVVAVFNKANKQVEIVQSIYGAEFEPSYFGIDDQKHPIFGEKARKRSLTHPECVVSRVKRSLGQGGSFSLGGKKYRSEEVIAEILQYLRLSAMRYLKSQVESLFRNFVNSNSNLKYPEEVLQRFIDKQKLSVPIKDVVLTVPAYFNDSQKRATRDSAEIAGLNIKRLLHEPTAAALAHGHQGSYSGNLAVIDLGGGTLDISLLEVENQVYEVHSVGGDIKLGGSDIDRELVNHVIQDIKKTLGISLTPGVHSREITRLQDACENMKIQLSSVSQYTLELHHFLNNPLYKFTMTRAQLEVLARPILDRLKTTIQKTLKDSELALDYFILVGNATRMPAVKDTVSKLIKAKHLRDINPGTVVAMGAALEAAILAGDLENTLIMDVVPHSLGIAVIKHESKNNELEMSFLIDRNSTIPIKKTETYTTTQDNQIVVDIEIYQGESDIPNQNHHLGKFALGGIKPAPAGEKTIEVSFDIDADCVVTVTAVDQETRNSQSITINDTQILSPQEKNNLHKKFKDKEKATNLEKHLEEVRREIDKSITQFNSLVSSTEKIIQEFFELFANITNNAQNYSPTTEQTASIREMFIEKDTFSNGIPSKYMDRFTSTINNITQTESKHLDFSSKNIVSMLQDRINVLDHYKADLRKLIQSIENEVSGIVTNWQNVLNAVIPNIEQMSSLEVANYYLSTGRIENAMTALESEIDGSDGLSKDGLELLLKCYIRLGARDEYKNNLQRFGNLIGLNIPDFTQLNIYLKSVEESVVLIHGISKEEGAFYGSGFAIAPNLIATNRHVIDGTEISGLTIIGKSETYTVSDMELDPINDIAILKVDSDLPPLRLGEFNFVEPGEQIFAVGFPAPSSKIHSENIYISTGIINSIRKLEITPERVIFMDAKIGGGMSGGPLFNSLGEVVGVVTCTYVNNISQPVALPIHIVKKYIMKYSDKQ